MFPYIKQIKVNDCFTYQDFMIPPEALKEKRHIILTGKNGSGKSTILDRINFLIDAGAKGKNIAHEPARLQQKINNLKDKNALDNYNTQLKNYTDVELNFFDDSITLGVLGTGYQFLREFNSEYIFSYFKASRKINLGVVKSVTKENDFQDQLSQSSTSESFIGQFKQYLVNKKVYEAFDYMNSKMDSINQNKKFFNDFASSLRRIFNDNKLQLEFVKENFEFYLLLGDKRRLTFNQLSDGFSAFISILMDLLMRTDLIRKTRGDFNFDPAGIVIIDEPETHTHIEMQYEILPLLSTLFPNVQLIIATHSPAIISSLDNAVVFDLSTKTTVRDWIQGSSYSELMVKHFGVVNEFSPKADELLAKINAAVQAQDKDQLTGLFTEYEKILTPSLRLEIESRIIELDLNRNGND